MQHLKIFEKIVLNKNFQKTKGVAWKNIHELTKKIDLKFMNLNTQDLALEKWQKPLENIRQR